ncbi:hypothetical protein GCM10009837_07010 [Streptomyces durmitorensis]|uniref:Uncharacterized protein n=1 Tax=Streptomyces durmitorensis TaxID=319947 RepID=A0ABY4PMP0_9ACTN|nr:hypothetical protein [Streptomyces durmitorensis]UQT54404.1 hypothetical protein M4V62_04480 [Streptomyces durmitorensis]
MSSADDILNQIDNALYDSTVGPDAMRSRPATEPGPRLWIAPAGTDADGDGWEEIGYVTGVDLTIDDGQDASLPDDFVQSWSRFGQRLREAEERRVRAAMEALRTLTEAFQRITDGLRGGDWVDTNGGPVQPPERPRPALPRRDDRPAWQSPHGPATRRRH